MLALAAFAAAALRPSASPQHFSRRAAAAMAGLGPMLLPSQGARALEETVRMPGLNGPGKSKTFFSDFELSATGLQFKDYKLGAGAAPKVGDKVSLEWTGVTVGYQGRYFETRNKPKGGAFADDGFLQEPLAFTVGGGTVIPAIDEAVRGMALGGIRRIIVPEEIGYPADGWKRVGPKPSTFSGQRALDFVLASKDSMMDKTLMFDLKLTSVRPAGVR
ncbi:fkbp-like peptidyl-prolyl cis-trans isomerase family protein [Chrysochromulina tobinii]|uniref:peptidylprolyl isomerase n=1 Tax=Chrysochromulina tobinii TaxID=1460289 RepID=A0A0M0J3R8_9EUKA|nr:fkbp-like peptidyl-prolyl cis-trans isomerase family protein [Chrysochromulina tobinii]|eukprot:KOO21175.1 fkbp-like peptidyl-prolyl cis-trans isomerase family protein [Chrysochromulina sp. CCMP291]